MTKKAKIIAADTLFKKWRSDPEYRRAYEDAEEEFSIAAAMIAARTRADITQAQLVKRMGTTQSTIARMESGRFKPSFTALEKYARATGSRLRMPFEPI